MEESFTLSYLGHDDPEMIDIWISEPAKKRLEAWLQPHMTGMEFGSGCSTVWLAQRVKHLVSVEHNIEWHHRVKTLLDSYGVSNATLIYAEPDNYLNVLKKCQDKSLDFVFNDGLATLRTKCIETSWRKIKKGGVMIIDNSEANHSKMGIRFIENNGAIGTRYWGAVTNPWTGRYNKKGVETSIWVK